MFQPIALETLDPINESAVQFLNDLAAESLLSLQIITDDKEAQFLFQRLSIALQRFSAMLSTVTFSGASGTVLISADDIYLIDVKTDQIQYIYDILNLIQSHALNQ